MLQLICNNFILFIYRWPRTRGGKHFAIDASLHVTAHYTTKYSSLGEPNFIVKIKINFLILNSIIIIIE